MTPQQIEAMKLALEALKGLKSMYGGNGHKLHEINMIHRKHDTAITALEEALAQTQEPDDGYCKACDGWKCTSKAGCVALDNPPQRTWVGLTDEQRSQLVTLHHGWNEYGQAIEASLKQQNGYAEENT